MKRLFALILTLVLCLSLCACGGAGDSAEKTGGESAPAADTTALSEEQKTITPESMAGTYESILWCFHDSFTMNANTSYDYEDGVEHTDNTMYDDSRRAEKGTFTISGNQIDLDQKLSSGVTSVLQNVIVGDAFYDKYWRYFEEDVDYGLAFSPDESGMTDQTFESFVVNADIPGTDHNCIVLDLNKDGSFKLELGAKLSTFKPMETYEGTYGYADSMLTLTYEGKDYPLFVTEKGQIYFVGYKKV